MTSSFRYLTPLEFMNALHKKCTKKLKYVLGNEKTCIIIAFQERQNFQNHQNMPNRVSTLVRV